MMSVSDKAEVNQEYAIRNAWDNVNRCPYEQWKWYKDSRLLPFDCKTWRCPIHSPFLAWRWKRRAVHTYDKGVAWTLFLTVTLVPEDLGRRRLAWQWLVRWLRDQGVTSYIKGMELGADTGMRHFHILLGGTRFVPVRALRAKLQALGFGKQCRIERIKNVRKAGAYVTKYCTKSRGIDDIRLRGQRIVTCSRDVSSWKEVLDARLQAAETAVSSWDGILLRPWDILRLDGGDILVKPLGVVLSSTDIYLDACIGGGG